MESQRINPTVAVQRSLSLTARLILFSILSLSVCPGLVIASHQTTASPQPAQPQPVQQPTKAGSGGTAEAMSGGIGASTSSFSIQSFNADLYSGTAGADIPIVVPPGAAGAATAARFLPRKYQLMSPISSSAPSAMPQSVADISGSVDELEPGALHR